MRKLLILFVLMAGFMKSHAQNISAAKLLWNSTGTMDPSNSASINEPSQFRTYSGDSIQWAGQDGALKSRLKILETNGSWNDASQVGSITYEVDNNGKRGVIAIERTTANPDMVKVRMVLTTDAEPQVYELTINSIQIF